MRSSGEKQGGRFQLTAWLLAAALFFPACASTPPRAEIPLPAGRTVVGSGTSDDQSVINSSNQTMFNSEHAMSPGPSAGSSNQGVP
jgi:hypothetical protein